MNSSKLRIGLDVSGGDKAPGCNLEGAMSAVQQYGNRFDVVLFGDRNIIIPFLGQKGNSHEFEIVHAPEVIEMGDHPVKALQSKAQSSIRVGFEWLKTGKIDAFASAGNSGAVLVGSTSIVGNAEGVLRPCIATFIPRPMGGQNLLLDIGLNVDCKPEHLQQFAYIGTHFLNRVHGNPSPQVGLLNIGHEAGKGNQLARAAFHRLATDETLPFIGNVESRDIFTDRCDVFVTDGFTGNMLLKQAEAVYRVMLKRNLMDEYFARFNYEDYGGTPVLGINKTVILGHGISSSKAIHNMLVEAERMSRSNFCDTLNRTLHHG
jgi:glycerol-3-phosphate acyltransferase PlsX